MDSSYILIVSLCIAVLVLLAVMATQLAARRKTDRMPPSWIMFVPIVVTALGIMFILALQLAKKPAEPGASLALPEFPLIQREPVSQSPDNEPGPTEICADRLQSTDDQNRYYIKKDICLTGYDRIDNLIAAEVETLEDDFLKQINSPEAMPLSIQFALDLRTEESHFDRLPAIQSIKLVVYKGVGGAHPGQEFRTWTFDRLTDRLIDFDLLFQEEHNPLWTIYPLVKAQLMSLPYADERMIDAGTGDDDAENYRHFTIENDQLVFYFEPGQVAAQAAGAQRVALPLADLQVILRPPFLNLGESPDEDGLVDADFISLDELVADCEDQGGNWLPEHDECEYVGQDWCEEYGATFLECESACRHQPDAQVCTLQCVPVCRFE